MVISRITMGLGNQMFQYAAGRALSLTLNQPLKLDISSYENYPLRKFELGNFFDFQPQIATKQEILQFDLSHPVRRTWNKLLPNQKIKRLPYEEKKLVKLLYELTYTIRPPHSQSVYEERQFHFDKNFFSAKSNVYLKGYWMSYKYFTAFEDIIKKDFTIKEHLVSHLHPIVNEMQKCNSIAVHIRCTDRKDLHNLKLYGDIPASYFNEGINYIKEKKGEVSIYLFSDNIELAKTYLPEGIKLVSVSGNITKNAIEDFYLITQCKNVIMPNSTFGWWAAYLNKQEDKIVITPERWYNEAPFNYKDIYYPGWIKMKN